MTTLEIRRLALQLSDDERLQLGQELIASVEENETSEPPPQWLADLLDQRLLESETDVGIPWTVVREEIWGARD